MRAYTDDKIQQERRQRFAINGPFIGNLNGQGDGNGNVPVQFIVDQIQLNLPTLTFHCIQNNEAAALGFVTVLGQVWNTLPTKTQAKLTENIVELCGPQIGSSNCLPVTNNFSGTKAMYSVVPFLSTQFTQFANFCDGLNSKTFYQFK